MQPRHALQTSDALGAASVQLGPRVLTLGALLNKAYGLSWEKVAAFIGRALGIEAGRATYCRAAIERLTPRAEPLYEALVEEVRQAPVVYPDETGWKVDGEKYWLWAFATPNTTIYVIDESRGFVVASSVLDASFSGILGRDGWHSYRLFTEALHQTCLSHLLRRANDILKVAQRGSARFAHAVKHLLKAALELRDDRDEYTEEMFDYKRWLIVGEMDCILTWNPTYEPNVKFQNHLERERDALFTFLFHPEVEATNWPAEQAIRPAVITRKMSGGNRSDAGARAQAVLTSILRTCWQRAEDAWDLLVQLFSGHSVKLGLTIPGPSG